jgi:hypothetical protein
MPEIRTRPSSRRRFAAVSTGMGYSSGSILTRGSSSIQGRMESRASVSADDRTVSVMSMDTVTMNLRIPSLLESIGRYLLRKKRAMGFIP